MSPIPLECSGSRSPSSCFGGHQGAAGGSWVPHGAGVGTGEVGAPDMGVGGTPVPRGK